MQISQTLAQEIREYIKNLLSKEVIIVDSVGKVIPSPGEADTSGFSLPRDAIANSDLKTIDINGGPKLLIPLKYQAETVAALLVNDTSHDMASYVPLIRSFAELLVQQYLEVNKPVLDSTDQFISKLLYHATPAEYPFYESESRVLGYNVAARRLAIVIHLENFWNNCLASFDQPSFEREEIIRDWKRKIENNLTTFFTKATDNIVAYIGNDKFIIFKGMEGEDDENIIKLLKKSHKAIFEPLKNFHIQEISVGFGNVAAGIGGMLSSYREADLALEFGARLWGTNKSYYFGDLGILTILGEGNREKEILFANQLLHKLTNDDLVKTLECFFEQNLNLTETANEMGIHRNTVIYRLNQISSILGVDPRVFEQAMTIKIALLIKKLFG
ncbi:MAG TPA: helix-turn-helix domain-containing protein [Patescibacteria group bacterium]